MPEVTMRVQAEADTTSQLRAKARQHEIIIDEPVAMGGSDEGANPLEYQLAALCGCVNVVARIVAKEMNINITRLTCDASGTLDPAKLRGMAVDGRAGFHTIDVKVAIESDADAQANVKLLKTVEQRCPVSDNLANATNVSVTMA